jgi:hypothetical protein
MGHRAGNLCSMRHPQTNFTDGISSSMHKDLRLRACPPITVQVELICPGPRSPVTSSAGMCIRCSRRAKSPSSKALAWVSGLGGSGAIVGDSRGHCGGILAVSGRTCYGSWSVFQQIHKRLVMRSGVLDREVW